MRLEHWLFTAPLRLRSILRRRRVEQKLAEELASHIELKIGEGLAAGLSADEARHRVLRAMGIALGYMGETEQCIQYYQQARHLALARTLQEGLE